MKLLALGWGVRWFGLSTYAPFVLIYLNSTVGLPYWLAGALLALPNLAGVLFPLLGGGLADRFGRRRVLVTSFAFESLGLATLAVGAFAGALGVVVGALVLTRASGTVGNPSVTAYVTDLTDGGRRAEGQAWMRTALNAGFTVGTLAGGAALSVLSFWQLASLTTVVTAVGVVLTVALVPPSPYDRSLTTVRRRVLLPPDAAPPRQGTDRRLRETLAASLRALYDDRALLIIWAATCATWTLNQQISYAVPAYAHRGLGLSYLLVGLALAVNTIVVVAAQVPLTRWLSGRSMTVAGAVGAAVYALAFVGIGLDGIFRQEILLVLLGLVVLLTLGECLIFYAASTLSMNLAPGDRRGAYSGAMQMSAGVGTVLAPLLAGLALGGASNPLTAWSLLALPAIPAVVLLLYLRHTVPADLDQC